MDQLRVSRAARERAASTVGPQGRRDRGGSCDNAPTRVKAEGSCVVRHLLCDQETPTEQSDGAQLGLLPSQVLADEEVPSRRTGKDAKLAANNSTRRFRRRRVPRTRGLFLGPRAGRDHFRPRSSRHTTPDHVGFHREVLRQPELCRRAGRCCGSAPRRAARIRVVLTGKERVPSDSGLEDGHLRRAQLVLREGDIHLASAISTPARRRVIPHLWWSARVLSERACTASRHIGESRADRERSPGQTQLRFSTSSSSRERCGRLPVRSDPFSPCRV